MRTHYGPWQPCWISNQHHKHKSGRGPSSEHFWQVWLKSVQRFQRRRFKCEKLTDGRTTDAYLWQKLTWPMAKWAKKRPTPLTITSFIYNTYKHGIDTQYTNKYHRHQSNNYTFTHKSKSYEDDNIMINFLKHPYIYIDWSNFIIVLHYT